MILTEVNETLDLEWLQLLIEAKNVGITFEEVQAFFQHRKNA
ncbi:anti-repressor SinI family protein [Ferdinandcohnia sp. Marseille-Q9671]